MPTKVRDDQLPPAADLAIDQPYDSVGAPRRRLFAVGNEHERGGMLANVVEDQRQDLLRRLALKVPRRLAGQNDPRPVESARVMATRWLSPPLN